MNERFFVVATLAVRAGCEQAFELYEQSALAIAAQHAGRLEQRIRSGSAEQGSLCEVHVLSFPNGARFEQYRADAQLLALADERARVISDTRLVLGHELANDPTPAPMVSGVDHIYLAVSDMARSEAYYDRVLGALGFHKGNLPVAGERHAHYFCPRLQISLRPARGTATHDPYAPGLHHLCMQVSKHADVDQVFARLDALGVAPSRPALHSQYNPDYYATFFEDPDGIRLEVVARTQSRENTTRHWHEFKSFVNPLAELTGKQQGVFHIALANAWQAAKQAGEYRAESLHSEGFIHCSQRAQVVRTANAYFRGQQNLILLQIDPGKLQAELRYEPPVTLAPEIFPHLYGALNLDAVVAEFALEPAEDGSFQLPQAVS